MTSQLKNSQLSRVGVLDARYKDLLGPVKRVEKKKKRFGAGKRPEEADWCARIVLIG